MSRSNSGLAPGPIEPENRSLDFQPENFINQKAPQRVIPLSEEPVVAVEPRLDKEAVDIHMNDTLIKSQLREMSIDPEVNTPEQRLGLNPNNTTKPFSVVKAINMVQEPETVPAQPGIIFNYPRGNAFLPNKDMLPESEDNTSLLTEIPNLANNIKDETRSFNNFIN